MIKSSSKLISFIGDAIFNKFADKLSNETSTCIGFADAVMKCKVSDIWKYAEDNDLISSKDDFEAADIETIELHWANAMVKAVAYNYGEVTIKQFLD